MPSTAQPSLPMPEISCVNPLSYRSALEQLFADHGRADHSEFFARAYPGAVAEGAKAWIGADHEGRVVMHASRFPHSFVFGDVKVTGGLIVNILVATPYRTHHPARALFERFIEDSRTDRQIDFLYTETTERGANVLKAAGARVIGRVGRFVLPIRGTKRGVDLAVKAYHHVRGIGTGAGRMTATHHPAAAYSCEAFDAPLGVADRLRGVHGLTLYRRRLKGYPTPLDHWITVKGPNGPAAALVRGPEANGLATLVKLNHPPSQTAATVLAMVPVLRQMECRVVQIYTVAESLFAGELRRAGFIERSSQRAGSVGRTSQPLVALPISPVGEDIVASIARWQITGLDLD
jgi:hypothetical protein